MIETKLANIISQAESWQSFRKFNLPRDIIVDYSFLKHTEDFYIELIGKMMELLEPDNIVIDSTELLSIAKGLQVYSLTETRDSISGINFAGNMLYVAGLYYLSDFSASALLLSNLFEEKQYLSLIDQFIWNFLSRKPNPKNKFTALLVKYLEVGEQKFIQRLTDELSASCDDAFTNSPMEYVSSVLATALVRKFTNESIWSSLLKYGTSKHWKDYVLYGLSKRPPVWDFFPSQKKALAAGAVGSGHTVSFQMPTSSGKSALCELIAYDELRRNPDSKVLFLAPFRAMASELKHSFAKRLAELDIISKTIYGGNIPTPEERNAIEHASLLIATPEKLIAVSNVLSGIMEQYKVVICDEGHLLDDSSRGLRYELLLSKLKSDAHVVSRRFVFISAIIPNIEEINNWLDGTAESVAKSTYRPTDLEYAFLRPGQKKGHFYLDYNPFDSQPKQYSIYRFLTERDFQYTEHGSGKLKKYKYNKKTTITLALALRSLETGAVAVFAPHKKGKSGVEALALELQAMLSANLPLPNPINHANREATSELVEYTSMILGKKHLLPKLCQHGAVYHTGDLPQYVREAFEDEIRNGRIKFVLCTNTLAEGVNLPIRSIVIHSTKRYVQNTWRPLALRDIRNLVGRAGRAGQETAGLVLVPHETDFDLMANVIKGTKSEAVYGHLFRAIVAITDFISKRGIKIEKEVLDHAGDALSEWLDSIDTSIIDLVAEDISAEDLEAKVRNVLSQTLAYRLSNDSQRDTLASILALRAQKVVPHVTKGTFPRLKRSGMNIREFDSLIEKCDFTEMIWEALDDALNDEWLDLILELAFDLPTMQNQLTAISANLGREFLIKEVKLALRMWLSGEWFETISAKLGVNVDDAVAIVNNLLLFDFLMRATGIIRCAEDTLSKTGRTVSKTILSWPIHLQLGVPKPTDVLLSEIGFYDRAGIIALRPYIIKSHSSNVTTIRSFIAENAKLLKDKTKNLIPAISWRATCKAIDYVAARNTL